jgi:hypothetical protein
MGTCCIKIGLTTSFQANIPNGLRKTTVKDEYPELTAVQVPDFLPPEIPRITAVSHHGFSNLSISTNSV